MTQADPNSRRRLILGAAVALVAGTATTTPRALLAQGTRLPPTPECTPGGSTPAQTEGPFYSPGTPQKSSFRSDARGDPIVLEGRVLNTRCVPIAGAWLDFWHADAAGDYDNSGFRLRGHQFSDAEGRYRLETILPALYPGRARHIHVKLRAPTNSSESRRTLTTQAYFPDDPGNARDRLVRPELIARRSGALFRLDFVLPD